MEEEQKVTVGGWHVRLSLLGQDDGGGHLSVRVQLASGTPLDSTTTIIPLLHPHAPPSSSSSSSPLLCSPQTELRKRSRDHESEVSPETMTSSTKKTKKDVSSTEGSGGVAPRAVMMDLPDEVQLEVLGWVPPHDLAATLPLVCRRWRALARDPALWQRLHFRLLGAAAPAAASVEGAYDGGGEEDGEEEGDDDGRASAALAELQRGLVWMPRQDKYHEIKREQELWALEKEKWKTRLLWAASEGYPAPVQQSLVELERLAIQPVPRGPLPRLDVRPPDQPLPRFTAKDHGPPIYRPWLGEPGPEPAAGFQQIDLLDYMDKAARMAAHCGHADVVRLLLDRGTELNLDLFCHGLRHGSLELAGLVLDRAPAALRSDSKLALELAVRLAECAHTATLDLLLERHFITQHIYDVALARGLAKAVSHNDIALASALLPAGASANATTAGLHKPLLFKAVAKGIDMVKLLLDYGAAPSVEFTGGRTYLRTPLDRAVSRGAVPIVELLLKRGAEPKVHESMPRFTGQGINDCLTLIQRAKRQSFVDSLRC